MKKIIIAAIILCSLLALCSCNKSLIDVTYTFDYAIISFPDGRVEEIEIEEWQDYEGEQIQVKDKDGNVYLVSSFNCVLVKEG